MEPDLDRWLADPQIRTRHRYEATADPAGLWHAAGQVTLREAPRLGRVVRWRIPGTAPRTRFRELFGEYPFTVLEEGELHSVSGLCGRVWTLRRDYPRLESPEQFRSWDERGTVRVLFAHWIEPLEGGRAALVSESRMRAVDRRAALRMRTVWGVVGRFERLIGGEALARAARLAEGS